MEQTEQTTQGANLVNSPVSFPGPAAPSANAPKKNWKWLVILILFLLVIGGVTFFVFKSSKSTGTISSPTPDTSSTLTNLATPEPTPTSAPVDKTQIKIQVLNGTGVAGEASYLSDQLNTLGYTNVTTGNAGTQNATNTQVIFGSNVSQDVVTEITNKLNSIYTSVTTNNTSISGFDIQITTGLRKGQTTAPAATSAPTATDTPTPTATP